MSALVVLLGGAVACDGSDDTAASADANATTLHESRSAEEPDSEKRLRVVVALRRSPEVYTPRMEIDVKDSVAYLTGSVEDGQSRRAAIELAAATPGIVRVVDKLEVFPYDAPNYRERVYTAFD